MLTGRTDPEAEAPILMRREDCLEKTLMLGKFEGKRRRGRPRTRWLDSVIKATNTNLTQLREAVEDRTAWCALVHGDMKIGHDLTTKPVMLKMV